MTGENVGSLADARLKAFAKALQLDQPKFDACLDGNRFAQNVTDDVTLGQSLGVSGTPTVFINGQLVSNVLDFAAISALIDAELAK